MVIEKDTYQANISLLEEDIRANKKIVLFVGAGINLGGKGSSSLSWNGLLNSMFKDALSILSTEKEYSLCERERLESLLCSQQSDEYKQLWDSFYPMVVSEFPVLVKASIIKSILGNNYIHRIRHQLYHYCDKNILRDKFMKYHSLNCNSADNTDLPFNSLFQIARLILLYEPIVAVVTYNYDKFLTMAVEVLWENMDAFFNSREKERIANNGRLKNGLRIEEIYGAYNNSQQNNHILPVYHIHGYIPPFNEMLNMEGNEIVLSMEECYDNVRNVYSWQTATQLHFLCHFTCMFIGNSLNDINPQRMIHYASTIGNDEKIYYLHASTKNNIADSQAEDYKSYLQLMNIKDSFYSHYGLTPIFEQGGYNELYNHLYKMLWEKE